MKHVYIDESGDLGRSVGSSRYIVVTALATNDPRRIDKIVRKVWTTKQHKKDAGELHAIYANVSTRFKLLSLLDEENIIISYTVIDKVEITEDLHEQYYVALARLVKKYKGSHVCIIDKRDTNKKRNLILKSLKLDDLFKDVDFADSRTVRQLQAVDFASWSIFKRLEDGDETYENMIMRRIEADEDRNA